MKNKVNPHYKLWIALIVVLLMGGACSRNPFRVNVSDIKTHIVITRFESDLFAADPSDIEDSVAGWDKKYNLFFRHFCYITRLGTPDEPDFAERLRLFVTDRQNYMLYKRTCQVFPDLNSLTSDLNNAFRHYLYYFPGKTVPKIYTYISGFNESAITDENLLGIGLDKYLGVNEPLYKKTGIYQYLIRNMHPRKIASDCMNFWGETEFPFNDSVNNLVANMIYRGRLMYFTRAMLPDQPDSLIWGFSEKDLKYMESSEKSMWAYLVEQKLLFSTDRFVMDKFILEGPFTKDFGRESPARAAVWVGYRIIESYMKRNSGIRLADLMNESDYLKILNNSGYNP